jgi:hypothetical protein
MVTSALAWCGAPALADTTPAPSPTTTTTPDAPPPDAYKPPVHTSTTKAAPRPARTAPVVHSTPTPVHHYAPAVRTTPRVAPAPTVRYTPHAKPKPRRHKKSAPVRHRAPKRAAVHLGLAPVAQLFATAEVPFSSTRASDNELLRLAGLAFALLAAASLSFVFLSRRADPIAPSS